jgi:hypothetical protein
MLHKRFYIHTRRAWTPRTWPLVLLDIAIIFPTSMLLLTTTWERILLGFVVGAGTAMGRWEIWKLMHPRITVDEYLADLRSAAPWN